MGELGFVAPWRAAPSLDPQVPKPAGVLGRAGMGIMGCLGGVPWGCGVWLWWEGKCRRMQLVAPKCHRLMPRVERDL